MEVHMQESTGNDRNTAIKQRLEVLFLKFIIKLSKLKALKNTNWYKIK